MILATLYTIVRFFFGLAATRFRPEAELRIEVMALRHQLRILQRQAGRPRLRPADRLLLTALGRILPRASLLVTPDTVLRWHRELVRRKWALYSRRPRRGRPPQGAERQVLILRLARENPRWGYRRIQGELIKLGCRCSHNTVRNILRRHGLLPAPRRGQRTWCEFIRQHAVGGQNSIQIGRSFAALQPEPRLNRTLADLGRAGLRELTERACTAG